MDLTTRQLQVLRWLDENPSHSSEWTMNGRSLRQKESVVDASHMKIEGPLGSILVAADDVKALRGLIVGSPTRDKVYAPNDAGKAILAR